jgi:hypothetical protein
VPIRRQRSLIDGGLREIGGNVQGIIKMDGIKKCTGKCAWLHRKMCMTPVVHGS